MDGLNSPEELVLAAKRNGSTAIAITDHGTLSGARKLQEACEKHGLKPIIGLEAYISSTDRDDNTNLYNHVILLAKSQRGLENLQELSRLAWLEGFYMKPRIDSALLEEYSEGLIVLSGCLNGIITKALDRDDVETADRWTQW